MEFPELSGFTTKDPADGPTLNCWLKNKFNYPKFQHITLLPVLASFLSESFLGHQPPLGCLSPHLIFPKVLSQETMLRTSHQREKVTFLMRRRSDMARPQPGLTHRKSKSVLSLLCGHLQGQRAGLQEASFLSAGDPGLTD